MTNAEATEKAVLAMVSGGSAADIEDALVAAGASRADAKAAIIDAKRSITTAANFDIAKEIGQARIRLDDLYKNALRAMDAKTALAIQKEISKLLDLYRRPELPAGEGAEGGTLAEQELEAIRQHLEPLKLAPDGYPLHELARIAADIVRKQASA